MTQKQNGVLEMCIRDSLTAGSFNPGGTGRIAEKRRTQGQAPSELFEAESQRCTETV